jgi:DUF4097 and DUF4098 domain-containing protein YvlB
MASNPGLQSSPPHYPHRSLAPAVTLIVLGVLFLLQKLHVLPSDWWHWFGTWWPLLLILAGVIRMVEYGMAQREHRPIGGFGALGIILFFLLIIGGLCATAARHFHGTVDFGDWEHSNGSFFEGMFGNPYDFGQELQHDFPAGNSLKIASDGGDINIDTWDQNQIKVSVRKRVRARDQAEATQRDAATQAQLVTNGNEIVLNANTLGAGDHGVKSDLVIYLPRKAALNIAARHGDVAVNGRTGEIELDVSHGDIQLHDVSGNIAASLHSGSISAIRIDGDVVVSGHTDEVTLTDISGKASMEGEVSDGLTLARIGKQVVFRSSRTDLEFAALPGELRLASDDLSARQVTGPLHLVTRSKDIHLENVSGDIHVENANGLLEVRPEKLPLGELELSNSHADIRLVLPAKAEFSLDATAQRGDIHSDFGGVSVTRGAHDENRASGHVGNGGARLEINNTHGDVEIRKS